MSKAVARKRLLLTIDTSSVIGLRPGTRRVAEIALDQIGAVYDRETLRHEVNKATKLARRTPMADVSSYVNDVYTKYLHDVRSRTTKTEFLLLTRRIANDPDRYHLAPGVAEFFKYLRENKAAGGLIFNYWRSVDVVITTKYTPTREPSLSLLENPALSTTRLKPLGNFLDSTDMTIDASTCSLAKRDEGTFRPVWSAFIDADIHLHVSNHFHGDCGVYGFSNAQIGSRKVYSVFHASKNVLEPKQSNTMVHNPDDVPLVDDTINIRDHLSNKYIAYNIPTISTLLGVKDWRPTHSEGVRWLGKVRSSEAKNYSGEGT